MVIELFFHGGTQWNEPDWPKAEDWEAIIDIVLREFGSPESFTLMGYSLGGRIALYTTSLMPLRVNRLILLGSDGLGMDRFYHFATRNRIGTALFKRFVTKPGFIERPLQWALKRKWISEPLYQFIRVKMDTQEKRQLLYQRWMSTGDLLAPPRKAAGILQEHGIQTILVMGRMDRVIPYHLGERFVQWYSGATLISLDQGHHIINEELNKVLAEIVE